MTKTNGHTVLKCGKETRPDINDVQLLSVSKKYIQYWWNASNGKGHGVHSPFVFEFITKVLNDKTNYDCYAPIENIRQQLLANQTRLTIEDFGAGSRTGADKKRSVQGIAAAALKPKSLHNCFIALHDITNASKLLNSAHL